MKLEVPFERRKTGKLANEKKDSITHGNNWGDAEGKAQKRGAVEQNHDKTCS